MPMLARRIAAPLSIDVRRDAVGGLGALIADRRIATEGRVAVALGPGQGDSIAADLDLGSGEVFRVDDGTVDTAVRLGRRLRAGPYEAAAGRRGRPQRGRDQGRARRAGRPPR